jgi:hypothetical protein
MAPPELQSAKRDYPLATAGVIMAILLAGLLALPFLSRTRNHTTRRAVSATAGASAQRAPVR